MPRVWYDIFSVNLNYLRIIEFLKSSQLSAFLKDNETRKFSHENKILLLFP